MLKFSDANAKTERLASVKGLQKYLKGSRKVYSLDLPAGYSCPGAKDCMSRCLNGKIKDGPNTLFRCFSASQEVTYPATFRARQHNFQLLRGLSHNKTFDLLANSLPKNAGIVRYHVSGDFFSLNYLTAAITFAWMRPDVLFYGYTKSLHLLRKVICENFNLSKGILTPNFLMTASKGGKYDELIGDMRTAKVIFDKKEAKGMKMDHTDEYAAQPGGSFCLLLHGVQPKGTIASLAWQIIKKTKGGYHRG